MPFDPRIPETPKFWTALERRLRDAVRLRAIREKRVQALQSAAGAVATIASFGAGLVMMFGGVSPVPVSTTHAAAIPISAEAIAATAEAGAGSLSTPLPLPERLLGHGYEVTVLTRFVTDPASDGRVLDVRGPTRLDVTADPAAGPVVIVIGQAIGTGLSFAG